MRDQKRTAGQTNSWNTEVDNLTEKEIRNFAAETGIIVVGTARPVQKKRQIATLLSWNARFIVTEGGTRDNPAEMER